MSGIMNFIASRVLFPVYEIYKKDRCNRFFYDVRDVQERSLEGIRVHQLQRLQMLYPYAARFQVYKERFESAGIFSVEDLTWESFNRIKPIGREDIRRLSNAIEERSDVSSLVCSATGGTTSAPVKFYMDKNAADHRWSATRYFDAASGYRPGVKIAYLWGATQDFDKESGGFLSRIMDKLVRRAIFLPANDMSEESMWRYYHDLRSFGPYLLQAYPSALAIFCRFLNLNGLSLSIPVITCTAELMTNEQRHLICSTLGSNPINWYGARDAGRIATECSKHNGMHLNCYGLHVGVDRGHGLGSALITDLWNCQMPIIRYQVGDMVELDDAACECGSKAPRIVTIAGRTADNFVAPGGRLVPGVAFTNRVLKGSEAIRGIQVIQKDYSLFLVRIVTGESFTEASQLAVAEAVDRIMGCENQVDFQIVDSIPAEASGKVRVCINEIPYERWNDA